VGSSREPRAQQGGASTEEIAAALLAAGSAVGAGGVPGPLAAQLARLLLPLLPAALLRLPGGALAADVALAAARIGAEASPGVGATNAILRAAELENVVYRALYLKAAAGRLARAVLGAEEGGRNEALRAAVAAERRHFASHLEASARRLAGARSVEALVELHGPVLGWYHGETRTPREPRPHHLAAHGGNFRPEAGPPVQTGAFPGVLPLCSCAAGPPHPGGPMIR